MDAFVGKITRFTIKKNGKKLQYYRIYVPKKIAEKYINNKNLQVLVIIGNPEWYHFINWSNKDNLELLFPRLPEHVKKELCVLKLVPRKYCQD